MDRIRVLVVDDDPDFADLTAEFLEREDELISVGTARSAADGRERFETGSFDCIVSDYDMPVQNGVEFLKTVREDAPDLPFILFTGKGSEEIAAEAISAGVTDYLQKELGSDQYTILANRIRNAVEKVRSDRQLERVTDLSRRAQDIGNIGVWEADLEAERGWWSEEVSRIFGLPSEETGGIGAGLEYFHPEDRPIIEEAFENAVTGGEPYDLELRLTGADGVDRWVRVRADPAMEDGDVVRIRGTFQDITERKTQERKRTQIIDRVTDAIVEVDSDWRFTLVNEQAERLYDMDERSLLGTSLWEVFPRARDTRFEDEYRTVMDTREPTSFVDYYPGLDGWFDIQVYSNDDGGLAFYFTEVTDRHERQRRYEAIFENAHTLTGLLDLDGTLLEVNETALSFGGLEREDVVGKLIWETYWFQSNDRAREVSREAVERARNGHLYRNEIRVQGTEEDAVIDFSLRPITNERGEVTLLIPEGRDITERTERQERLEHQQSLFEALIESSIEGILVVDEEREYVTWNEQFLDLWGVPESLLGDSPEALGLEWAVDQLEDPDEFVETVEYLYEHPEAEHRDEIRLEDGRVLDRYSAPVEGDDGTYYGRVWFFRDVTEG